MKTVAISHGSSLTWRLLGDVGRFLDASDTPVESEEWGVPLWSRPIRLGDKGREDSWLWEGTCEESLAKRATEGKKGAKATDWIYPSDVNKLVLCSC